MLFFILSWSSVLARAGKLLAAGQGWPMVNKQRILRNVIHEILQRLREFLELSLGASHFNLHLQAFVSISTRALNNHHFEPFLRLTSPGSIKKAHNG